MKFLPSALIACLLAVSAQAQTPSASPSASGTPGPNPHYWRANMPGGTFVVKVDQITSLSMHEYVVDGTTRVTELCIGINGPIEPRFYFIEPNTPQTPDGAGQSAINTVQDKVQEAMSHSGSTQDVWEKVVKNYPVTTHAHTVEYRVESKDELQKIFDSIDTLFTHQQGNTFNP